ANRRVLHFCKSSPISLPRTPILRRKVANLARDAEMPLVAATLERRRAMLEKASAILATGWPEKNSQRRRFCRALIGPALDFTTWRSLTAEQRLRPEEALEAAIAFVKTAWRLDVPIAG